MKAINKQQMISYPQQQAILTHKATAWKRKVALNPVEASPRSLAVKKMFDFVLAFLGISLSSPLWLIITLAILFEDGGPVFYRQPRVGKNGKLFNALKFRTMEKNAEEGLGPVQALKNDPRITNVGNVLRKTALDELPQLWNILVGEMSFVGPRPLRPGEILADARGEQVRLEDVPGFEGRITVTPGLTGLAQVYATKNIHHRQKFKYDLLYIKKGGFYLDLKLILLSFLRSFSGRWEA